MRPEFYFYFGSEVNQVVSDYKSKPDCNKV